jgi:curved DNA-binding protein CbpA
MDDRKRNHYELLGLEKGASSEEIKQAFKEIALVYHPDSNFFDEILVGTEAVLPPDDVKKFQEISHAYSILSNENKRVAYDAELVKDEVSRGLNLTGEWIRPDGTMPQEAKKIREKAPTITNLQKLQKQYEESVEKNTAIKKNKTLQTFADVKSKRLGHEEATNTAIIAIIGLTIIVMIVLIYILI